MELMRLISVRLRLIGGFAAVCGLLIGTTLIGLRIASEQQRLAKRIDQMLVLTRDMGQVKFRISDISGWQLSYAWEASWLGGRPAVNQASPSRRAFEDSMTALDRELNAVERGPVTPSEAKLLLEVRQLVALYADIDRQIVDSFRQDTPEGFRNANSLVLGASYETARKIQVTISKLVVSVSERSTRAQEHAKKDVALGKQIQLMGSLIALLLALTISWMITRSIVVTVHQIVRGLEKLVEDESSPKLSDTGRDELTDIARAFNRTASLLESAHVEQRDLTDRLRNLAFHDPLTGLLNRAEFFSRVETAVARAQTTGECLACLLIDLDDFKPVNDEYGHAAGDLVLVEVANRMRSQVRSTDLVARLGGDEFAVFLEGGSSDKLVDRLPERIEAAVGQPIAIGNHQVTVTASVGFGVDCGAHLTANELLEAADTAMYAEKRRRKQQSSRTPDIQRHTV